ncbi:hypothetical protein NR800_22005 [Corallococcus interemptor]|uniref:hypothetical protein n=1 Tax=Corallococcus TaxID=83461 RepID=UPI001CBCB18F|nr:hypothetical protein [Corallococcus sp. AS-1-12]MBZ4330253.1 hypothetical protein [Corallococcus sp. AS-1-12]
MSVAILVKFKSTDQAPLYIPVATQGEYHGVWLSAAEKLGLKWVPLFEDGPVVDVSDLPSLLDEFRQLRKALAGSPTNALLLEHIDSILEQFGQLDLTEVSKIVIG